jgi:diadenosine tetraphosphate (Ap4A) HIT family hydrolase
MITVGAALERVCGALKINYQILGNSVPHLHCHIQPRYYGDPYPDRPVEPSAAPALLTPQEYQERANAVRDALGM